MEEILIFPRSRASIKLELSVFSIFEQQHTKKRKWERLCAAIAEWAVLQQLTVRHKSLDDASLIWQGIASAVLRAEGMPLPSWLLDLFLVSFCSLYSQSSHVYTIPLYMLSWVSWLLSLQCYDVGMSAMWCVLFHTCIQYTCLFTRSVETHWNSIALTILPIKILWKWHFDINWQSRT